MGYLLHICTPEKMIKIQDPSPETIDKAVDELLPVEPNFLILETDEPIDCCEFVQTAIVWEDDETDIAELRYDLEVHFSDGKPYRQYGIETYDPEFVKRTMRMFALGVTPKIDSNWKDITNDILSERHNNSEDSNEL